MDHYIRTNTVLQKFARYAREWYGPIISSTSSITFLVQRAYICKRPFFGNFHQNQVTVEKGVRKPGLIQLQVPLEL